MNNLFLIGFMGAGKSSVSAGLGRMLGRESLEMDQGIAALMEQRRPKYEAAADITVDTSHLSIEEVCRQVLRRGPERKRIIRRNYSCLRTINSWTLGDQCAFEERIAAANAAGFEGIGLRAETYVDALNEGAL